MILNTAQTPLTVLVIDDEHLILDIAKEMLAYLGHKAILSSSPEEGIETFRKRKHEIDLVIIDLLMPEMNGKDCAAAIRKIHPDVPLVLSTGISDAGNKEGLKNMDVIGFLEKPYNIQQLENMLQKINRAQ